MTIDEESIFVLTAKQTEYVESVRKEERLRIASRIPQLVNQLEAWIRSLIGGRRKIADDAEIARLTVAVEAWVREQPSRPTGSDGMKYLETLIGRYPERTLELKVVLPAIQKVFGKLSTGKRR